MALLGHSDSEVIAQVREKLKGRPQLEGDFFARTFFPDNKREIAKRVWEITKRHSVADITGIIPEDKFVADLRMDDLDSLSLVELTIELEKEFDIKLEDGRLEGVQTFAELVDEICRIKDIK